MKRVTLTPTNETRATRPGSNPALPLTRRQVLGGLTGVAALGLAGGCGPALQVPLSPLFPLGVASGEASASGVLLWTRFAGTSALTAEVWRAEAGEVPPLEEELTLRLPASVAEAGVVRLAVEGLAPGTRYRFRFRDAEGSTSPPGRFRTALAADALERVVVGATSCTRYGHAMDTLARAAEHEVEGHGGLDAFLWLGDACYTDVSRTPEEYRAKWEQTLGEPGQQAVRAATAMLATWDDHEFVNDWAQESDPSRFLTATDAFFAHMPVRQLAEAPRRLWRSVRWGRTVEFFVLDTRGERRPSTRLTPEAEYLSRTQLDWLKEGLASSPCVFKVVLNSVPISEFPGTFFQATAADRWEGFPAQRAELLRHVEETGTKGVLWVAGDFHFAQSGRVSRTGPGANAREVLVGPGANTPNIAPSYPGPPQVDWATGINNYAVLDFAPATGEVTVGWHAADGRVLHRETFTP